MARQVKAKSDDQPEPGPSDELELNLAFASTRDIVAELLKRCDCAVIALQLTDLMMESEPNEADGHRTEGGRWTVTNFTGSIPACIGLTEVMKYDLLKAWE